MRRLFLGVCGLVAITIFGTVGAWADTMNYTVTGTYGDDVPTTSLVSPGAAFTFIFSVPLPVVVNSFGVDFFTTTVPLSYSSRGSSFSGPGEVLFADTSAAGLFSISVAGSPTWEFFGAQIFSGSTDNPTLIEGSFAIDAAGSDLLLSPDVFGTFKEGTVTAELVPTAATPESGSLVLLGSGLLGLASVMRRKKLKLGN
ncbi:MAG: hypothetical protein NVS9B4_09190 [Candidatus Acidiferrum sp.]